jgi:hypothetical protein
MILVLLIITLQDDKKGQGLYLSTQGWHKALPFGRYPS